MLEYDRIYVSEGIDVNKATDLRECNVCYYWYFKVNFKFQPKVCNGCHNVMQKAMNFNGVAIASVKGNDDRI